MKALGAATALLTPAALAVRFRHGRRIMDAAHARNPSRGCRFLTPETGLFLAKARRLLDAAGSMLAMHSIQQVAAVVHSTPARHQIV